MGVLPLRRGRGPERYLFPGEHILQVSRRHPIVLARVALRWLLGLALATLLGVMLAGRTPPPLSQVATSVIAIAATAVAAWRWAAWSTTRYVITDERILVFEGVLAAKVSGVALFGVADSTFTRPLLGRILGYGDLTLHGPDGRKLRTLTHLRKPVQVYRLIAFLVDEERDGRKPRREAEGGRWTDPHEADTGPLPPVVV